MNNLHPIEFINLLKNSDDYIEKVYIGRGCYQFFKILKAIYPSSKAYKAKINSKDKIHNHIITLIDNNFYDITGIVNDVYINVKPLRNKDITRFEEWHFSNTDSLTERCPKCGEDISLGK